MNSMITRKNLCLLSLGFFILGLIFFFSSFADCPSPTEKAYRGRSDAAYAEASRLADEFVAESKAWMRNYPYAHSRLDDPATRHQLQRETEQKRKELTDEAEHYQQLASPLFDARCQRSHLLFLISLLFGAASLTTAIFIFITRPTVKRKLGIQVIDMDTLTSHDEIKNLP